MAFRLAYLHLTLAYYRGQGQHHAHFDCEYLASGQTERYSANITIQGQGRAHIHGEYL